MTNMQDSAQILKQLRKELRVTRVFCVLSSILTIFLLVGGLLVVAKAQDYAEKVNPVIKELSKLDVEEFNDTVENVNTTISSVDWELVSAKIDEIDVEALNKAVEDLDTEELSETLTNLNDAVAVLKSVGEKIQFITDWFN